MDNSDNGFLSFTEFSRQAKDGRQYNSIFDYLYSERVADLSFLAKVVTDFEYMHYAIEDLTIAIRDRLNPRLGVVERRTEVSFHYTLEGITHWFVVSRAKQPYGSRYTQYDEFVTISDIEIGGSEKLRMHHEHDILQATNIDYSAILIKMLGVNVREFIRGLSTAKTPSNVYEASSRMINILDQAKEDIGVEYGQISISYQTGFDQPLEYTLVLDTEDLSMMYQSLNGLDYRYIDASERIERI